MREILFRGKCEDGYDYSNGDGWVYGSLLQDEKVVAIVKTEDIELCFGVDDGVTSIEDFACIPVKVGTVGQYTGVKDKNGTKIFEGDILKDRTTPEHGCYIVASLNKEQQLYYRDSRDGWVSKSVINFSNLITESIKVIGNIHDNPELIKQ